MPRASGNDVAVSEPASIGTFGWILHFLRRLREDAHDLTVTSLGALQRARALVPGNGRTRRTAALLVVVTIAGLSWNSGFARDSKPVAPPALASAPCRPDPMAHVHHPSRLIMVSRCSTVAGVVKRAAYDPVDGDTVMAVTLDAPYRRFLPSSNKGELVVKVIPTDVPSVRIPLVGEHATFHGAWVLDRNADRRAEIHPAWSIMVEESTGTPPAAGSSATGSLSGPVAASEHGSTQGSEGKLTLAVDLPKSVPVGAAMPVTIRVRAGEGDQAQAASEAHLFVEVISDSGDAVRWKALTSNTLGVAAWHMVTLQPPGKYTVVVYAEKGGQTTSAKVPFTVRRR